MEGEADGRARSDLPSGDPAFGAERLGHGLRRLDPRPAAGLLHQLFVLARLCEWHDRLGGRAIPERVAEAREDLTAAHATVCAELPLPDAGRALVSTIRVPGPAW